MAYAVLRCQKVKSNQVSYVHNHNQRTYENQSADNVDFERTQQNIVVLGSAETHKKLKENLSRLESKKAIRKDANVLLEFVFSASHIYKQIIGYKVYFCCHHKNHAPLFL